MNISHESNNSRSADEEVDDVSFRYMVSVILGVVAIVGFVGNCTVVIGIISNKHLHKPVYIFIAQLAVTDVILSIAVIPFNISNYVYDDWMFTKELCYFYTFMLHVTICSGGLSLLVVSIYRCALICYRHIYRRIDRPICLIISSVFVWIEPIIIIMTTTDKAEYVRHRFSCRFTTTNSSLYFAVLIFIPSFVVPVALYIKIACVVRKSHRNVFPAAISSAQPFNVVDFSSSTPSRAAMVPQPIRKSHRNVFPAASSSVQPFSVVGVSSSTPSRAAIIPQPALMNSKDFRLLVTTVVITVVYVICGIAPGLLAVFINAVGTVAAERKLAASSIFLSRLQPVCNFLTYSLLNKDLRKAFFGIWKRVTCRKSEAVSFG